MTGTDVPVRDASTVILLRDSPDGLETWLLTRVEEMVFAARQTVFPGGRVEESDLDLSLVATDVAVRFGCTPELARALVGAAARETFEEAGVLLTSPPLHLGADRSADVEAGRISFAALLREHFVAVDESLLRPWARWITPVGEPRRYDTRFFVAAMPLGAQAENRTTESSVAAWVNVADALREVERGERAMLPPTIAALTAIRQYETVEQVLAAADERDLAPVLPTFTRDPQTGAAQVTLPDGTEFRLPPRP